MTQRQKRKREKIVQQNRIRKKAEFATFFEDTSQQVIRDIALKSLLLDTTIMDDEKVVKAILKEREKFVKLYINTCMEFNLPLEDIAHRLVEYFCST